MTLELSETIKCEDGRKITVNIDEKEIRLHELSDGGVLDHPRITLDRADFSKVIELIRQFDTAHNAMINSGPNTMLGGDNPRAPRAS